MMLKNKKIQFFLSNTNLAWAHRTAYVIGAGGAPSVSFRVRRMESLWELTVTLSHRPCLLLICLQPRPRPWAWLER